MTTIDPGFAHDFDITPNPKGATRVPVCHPYQLPPPLQSHSTPSDRSDFTRDDEATGA